jgi:hypothetical protein
VIEPGQICRDLSRKTFKIAIVLGPALKGDKLRVCRWQPDDAGAGGHWCAPSKLPESPLLPLASNFDLTSRRGLIVSAARRTVVEGYVRSRGLANDLTEVHYVGTVRP